MAFNYTGFGYGLFAGLVLAFVGVYRYIASHLTPREIKDIYTKAKAAVDEYEKAKADGNFTTAEKLEIAEKALAAIQEVIKDLEG